MEIKIKEEFAFACIMQVACVRPRGTAANSAAKERETQHNKLGLASSLSASPTGLNFSSLFCFEEEEKKRREELRAAWCSSSAEQNERRKERRKKRRRFPLPRHLPGGQIGTARHWLFLASARRDKLERD